MKDPAVLFYPGDFLCETMGMSRIERDCYIDLYILQFNQFHFSEDMARNVLKEDFETAWPNIKNRFLAEGEYFYNGNLRAAIAKRRAYTASRKEIAGKRKKKETAAAAAADQTEINLEDLPGTPKKDPGLKRTPVQQQLKLKPEHIVNGLSGIWDQLAPDVKKRYQEQMWNNFFVSRNWMEETCKIKGWHLKEFEKSLSGFLKDNVITGEISRGEKKLKIHFINKFKKECEK
jgi:hypothetical protein